MTTYTTRSAARRIAELESFARDPENLDPLCVFGALQIWRNFSAEVWGYWSKDNPEAVVGKSCGGHDFAIVDGRFLVDAWASDIEGLPIGPVIDLESAEGSELAVEWYGTRDKWMKVRDARTGI